MSGNALKISVIIPFYNAREFVVQAVESALMQPETGEVLLIEDGSPDRGLSTCKALAKKHATVRLLQHPDGGNHGGSASRNLGIRNARFPLVAFLDADDFYLPDRFKKTMGVFLSHPQCDGVYEAIGTHFNEEKDRQWLQRTTLKTITTIKSIIEPEFLFEKMISLGSSVGYFHLDGFTVKKELLMDIGLFIENMHISEDTDLIIKCTARGRLYPGNISSPVGYRRIHDRNRITYHLADKRKTYATDIALWSSLYAWGRLRLTKKRIRLVTLRYLNRLKKSDYFPDFMWKEFVISRYKMFKLILLNPNLILDYQTWNILAPSRFIFIQKRVHIVDRAIPKRINVLFVSNLEKFLGGASRSLYDLLVNLDRKKVNPFYASIHDNELTESIRQLGIPILRLSRLNLKNPFPYILSTFHFLQFIKKNRIRIVHNNQSYEVVYSWIPAKVSRIPIVTHLRESHYYRLNRFLIRHVTANICISNWVYKQVFHCNKRLIHNGIDLNKFVNIKQNRKNKRRVTVCLLGRINPIKGQKDFIKSARLVSQTNRNVDFRIIGNINSNEEKKYKDALQSFIHHCQLDKQIRFIEGNRPIEEMLGEMDISVVPSHREPFGRVITESMASYLPVIATNVGGARDIVTKQTGILIHVGNEKELADAIDFLVKNPDIRIKMGQAGRRRVEKLFKIDMTLSKIYLLYDEILSGSRNPSLISNTK
jgi:glycosyltransferase involved in cell wall biosynthesis